MSKPNSEIKILNAALEERTNGDIILRGSLDSESLKHLRVDDYQREVLAPVGGAKSKLRRGIAAGAVLPDIELGMRGQNFSSRGKTVTLHDPVFIVDGLQRVSAMIGHLESEGAITATEPLGATIHFKTTKEWESGRFKDLNTLRIPVSPNVILRNSRDKHPSILTLYGLSKNDPDFVLYNRVSWNQRMAKGEILTAVNLARSVRSLIRSHQPNINKKTAIGSQDGRVLGPAMDIAAKAMGLNNYRETIKRFYEIIDTCWGIRNIEYTQVQGHLRGNFLITMGAFFANNPSLWKDASQKVLDVDAKTKTKLKSFAINDPEIRRLCAGGSMVLPIIYNYVLEHMNKGKHKNRFK